MMKIMFEGAKDGDKKIENGVSKYITGTELWGLINENYDICGINVNHEEYAFILKFKGKGNEKLAKEKLIKQTKDKEFTLGW